MTKSILYQGYTNEEVKALMDLKKTGNQGLKIMILTTGLAYGGAEMQLVKLAINLKKRGHEILVVSMLQPKEFVEELAENHIDTLNLGMQAGVPNPKAILRLARYMRKYRPQILHSHMVHANLLGRIVRMFAPVQVQISTIHSINEGGRVREYLYRITNGLSTVTTIISEIAAKKYIDKKIVPKRKLKYIPNGIEIDSFRRDITIGKAKRIELGISNQFVWLAVGRVESEKDYPNLIMAFNELIKSNGNCVLVIVGEGSKLDEIKELAIELGVDEKIKFLGKRSDIKDLMSMSDSFVLSSIYEGLPMVLLEASVCELPLIATDVGGNREVINDGENGYLVSKSNPMELAGKMLQIMNLGVEERLNMGNKARKYVEEKYRIEKVLDEWEKLYYENI